MGIFKTCYISKILIYKMLYEFLHKRQIRIRSRYPDPSTIPGFGANTRTRQRIPGSGQKYPDPAQIPGSGKEYPDPVTIPGSKTLKADVSNLRTIKL